jgi:rubrerythrin
MERFTSVDEILDFAIHGEEESHRFYLELSTRAARQNVRDVFEGFAREELGHRDKLLALKAGRIQLPSGATIQDLAIADYMAEQKPDPYLGYAQALILAMQKEKAAFRLYTDLAERVDGEARALLLALANEEARHKIRFEIEYDDMVLKEN